jgi:hypothetical protein
LAQGATRLDDGCGSRPLRGRVRADGIRSALNYYRADDLTWHEMAPWRGANIKVRGDRSTASRQVRPASFKGRRTPSRRAGRSRAGRSRKPNKWPDGWVPTTARRGRRPGSPDAATQGRPGPGRPDRGAGRARRERTLPAMAQPLGRDPSRPFAALAAHEDPSLSHPGHGVRRARQRDAARALSHESFLLVCTYHLAGAGFNKVNGLAKQSRRGREPLLARRDNAADIDQVAQQRVATNGGRRALDSRQVGQGPQTSVSLA